MTLASPAVAAGFLAGTRPATASTTGRATTVSLAAMIRAHSGVVPDVASPAPFAPITATRTPDPSVPATDPRGGRVASFALAQLGKPYVFATSGPDTYDCSGLVAAAYRSIGMSVPAYTGTLATLGRQVDTANEPIRPGDLVFVRGGSPVTDLGHVGVAVSADAWVRAPRTGDVVKEGQIPVGSIQMVRRLIEPSTTG